MQELQFWTVPRLQHNLPMGLKQKQGWTDTCPMGFPGSAIHTNNAVWGGKLAGLQPEQQQAIKQDSNDFLFTEGPVVSGPCLLPVAPWLMTMTPRLPTMTSCASLMAQLSSQEPGLGLSASRIPRNQAQGISVEGPSSAQSGSSQPPTASSMPGREQQGVSISTQHQQVPCVGSTMGYSHSVSLQYSQCLGIADPN